MNVANHQRMFSLSDACRAAGSVTPLADRRKRRALFFAWFPAVLAAAAAAYYAGGAVACAATLAIGLAVLRAVRERAGRRRRELWNAPFPPKYERFLTRGIPQYGSLGEPGRELFRQRAKLFLDEVVFHGGGVRVTDGMRLRAAAAAVVPTLGFAEWEWPLLNEIIFRPEGYENGAHQDDGGVITEYEESGMVGSSGIFSGTMMLSSEDLAWEFAHPGDGANVGFHEFAHLMVLQGLALDEGDRGGWPGLMQSEFARIRRNESLLDEYALLDEDEFFAVASELFFTIPLRFRNWHPRLYAVLARCYRQAPAAWLDTGESEPDTPPRRRRKVAKNGRSSGRMPHW